jgi:hypothetical protein
MTSLEAPQTAPQPGQTDPQAPVPPGVSPSQTNVPGLPPTALSMQVQSLNDQYQQAQQAGGGMQALGAELQTGGPLMIDGGQQQGQRPAPQTPDKSQYGVSSLQDMAEQLARGYGLDFSRGSLINEQGNFQQTPDQLAAGGDLGDTAANMNLVSQAINDRMVEQQQNKATAALQAGIGQVQQRGRGSLAQMQSGFYQAMAANYTNPNLLPEQQDFSFWIQKDQMEEAMADRQGELADQAAAAGGGSSYGGGAGYSSQPTADNPKSSDTGPTGSGDVVTTGPHAGQRPVYTYDPINKTTTISWEDA